MRSIKDIGSIVLRVGKNRETPAKTQPFQAERLQSCCRGGWLCRHHNPKPLLEAGEFMAENLTESAFHLVTDDCRTDTTGNDHCSLGFRKMAGHHPHPQARTMEGDTGFADLRVLISRAKPRSSRQPQTKPGCGVRNGSQRPSEGGVCGLDGDDGSEWRDRLWSPCEHGSRIGVCACVWKVDRCASYLKSLK